MIRKPGTGGVEVVEAGDKYSVSVDGKVITLKGIDRISSVEVYNVSGQLVYKGTSAKVDLSNQTSAVYLLRIIANGNVYASKVKI